MTILLLGAFASVAPANDGMGITAALHPDGGSCIMTRDEIWSVMEGVNSRDVKLGPDTGELVATDQFRSEVKR